MCDVMESVKLSDKEGSNMTEYIVGTHMDDFIQIYNGRVSIKGVTNIENIFVSAPLQPSIDEDLYQSTLSQILINSIPFDPINLNKQYWFKSIDQVQ